MPTLDIEHTWKIEIGGNDYSNYLTLEGGGLTWAGGDRGRTWWLEFTLEDNGSMSFNGWDEVILTADPDTANEARVFGGYLMRVKPLRLDVTTKRGWRLRAEGYMSRVQKAVLDDRVWLGQNVGMLVANLFALAGLTDFDTTTVVSTGNTIERFGVRRDEKLESAMDRLITLAGSDWTWGVDEQKRVYAGPSGAGAAPFALSDVDANIDYTTVFPMVTGSLEVTKRGEDMFNRIRIDGGRRVGDEITEIFAGSDGKILNDGSVVFALSNAPVQEFVSVTLNETEYVRTVDWGWDWVTPDATKTVYGDKSAGTVRFKSGVVQASDTIVVRYRSQEAISVTRVNSPLYASMGFYLDGPPVIEPSISTQAEAETLGDAILALPGVGSLAMNGSCQVERLGIKPGQMLNIESTVYGLSGPYQVLKTTNELILDGLHVRTTITFGDADLDLREMIKRLGSGHKRTAYEQTVTTQAEGEIGIQRINNRIELLQPGTTLDLTDMSALEAAIS